MTAFLDETQLKSLPWFTLSGMRNFHLNNPVGVHGDYITN